MSTSTAKRDYEALARELRVQGDRVSRMQGVVDALWEGLSGTGVSWIGFYTKTPGRDEMLLGPRRDKPACSPIGLHGACGRCWQTRKSLVVTDVAKLGAGYIACDPRDRSEVVVPLLEADGTCWGVLDADSYEVGAFNKEDAAGLALVMRAAGLTGGDPVETEVV